jgi:hypothetical protein
MRDHRRLARGNSEVDGYRGQDTDAERYRPIGTRSEAAWRRPKQCLSDAGGYVGPRRRVGGGRDRYTSRQPNLIACLHVAGSGRISLAAIGGSGCFQFRNPSRKASRAHGLASRKPPWSRTGGRLFASRVHACSFIACDRNLTRHGCTTEKRDSPCVRRDKRAMTINAPS